MGRNVRRTKRLIKRRINSTNKRFTKSRIKVSNRKSKIKVSKKRLTKRRMNVSKRRNKKKMKGGMDAARAIRGPNRPFGIEGVGDPAYNIVTGNGSINDAINKPIILLILISFIIIYNHINNHIFNEYKFNRLLNAMGIDPYNYMDYYNLVYNFISGKDVDEFIKAIYYFIDYFTLYYICLGLNSGQWKIINTFANKIGVAYSEFISAAKEESLHEFDFSAENFIRIGRILGKMKDEDTGCPDFLIMYDRYTHYFVSTAQRNSSGHGLFSGYYPNYYPQFNEHYTELIIDEDIYRDIFTKIPELIRLMVEWNEALRRRQEKSAPNPTDSIFPSLVNSTPEVIQTRFGALRVTPGKNKDALPGSTQKRSGSTQKRSPSSALVGSPDIEMTRQILPPAVPQQPSNTSSQREEAQEATKKLLAQRAEQRAAQLAAQRARRKADAQEASARQRALVRGERGDNTLPSIAAPQIR